MKTTFVKSIILGLFAMASVATVQAEEAGKEAVGKESSATVKVLVVVFRKTVSAILTTGLLRTISSMQTRIRNLHLSLQRNLLMQRSCWVTYR